MKNDYMVDLPYPEVVIDSPCINDVKCLMDSYGGMVSETTAIFLYAYQAYVAESTYGEEWHKMFEGIAITEMHHHELLGETIWKLGSKPIIAGNTQFWNGGFVNYSTNLRDMLLNNIKSEEMAIAGYKQVIRCLDNYSIIELIERIIMDEELHIKIFKDALNKLNTKCD